MYKRILVPLDGSDTADQALPYAHLIAQAVGADIELFEAIPAPDPPNRYFDPVRDPDDRSRSAVSEHGDEKEPGPPALTPRLYREGLKFDASNRLTTRALSLREQWPRVRTVVREGEAAEAIALEVANVPRTLVVIATHGRSAPSRWLLGSVADKVIHLSVGCPTFLVRVRARQNPVVVIRITRILLPLDGSELAEVAMPHAAALATALDLEVTCLTATPIHTEPGDLWSLRPGLSVDDYLNAAQQRLKSAGVTKTRPLIVHADPGEAIINAAGATQGDTLVVMTSHGRSGLSRWALGSISDKVARHGDGPVMIVRPPG